MIYLKRICHPDEFISDNSWFGFAIFYGNKAIFFAHPEKIVKKTTEIC